MQQLSDKMSRFALLKQVVVPPVGWIKAIRKGIGMSLEQLGKKMSISKQAVLDMEKREKEGAITLRSLKQIAKAMDMHLVYGFVPYDGTLEDLVERKAKELATKIVMRTANTMNLEDQANTSIRIEKAIEERASLIKNQMPKILWD